MCGIGGIFNAHLDEPELLESLCQMRAALAHRGPDGSGLTVDRALGAGLTFTRLSLVDPDNGDQPLASEDGALSLVANCEIYNHRELRRSLQQRRHRFATGSDAEVLVHLYEDRELDCFDACDGMYALGILDRRRGRVVLARDGPGMRQVYYHLTDGGTLVFASEVKAVFASGLVEAAPDWEGLDTYLAVGFVPATRSCFAGVRKLEAGTCLVVDRDRADVHRFWQLRFAPDRAGRTDASCGAELEGVLQRAVTSHLAADAEVGVLLSGGWDSSLVATMASRVTGPGLQTFSIVLPDSAACDEGRFARLVARQIRSVHHETEIRASDVPQLLDDAVWFREEPFVGPAPLEFQLFRMTSRYVKAVLAGQGADELFGGYPWLRQGRRWYRYRKAVPPVLRGLIPDLPRGPWRRRLRVLGASDDVAADIEWFRHLTPLEKEAIFLPNLRSGRPDIAGYRPDPGTLATATDQILRRMSLDFTRRLGDGLLTSNDRMAMAHGVEVRLPFLDRHVIQFALGLPTDLLVRGDQEKYIMSLLVGTLPPEVAARRKFGLRIPLQEYLDGPLREYVWDRLLDPGASSIFDRPALHRQLQRWSRGDAPNLDALWCLVVLRVWYDKFFGPARTWATPTFAGGHK